MSFLDSLLGGIRAVFYNGTLQPLEPAINFTGAGVTVTDDPSNGFSTVTIPGAAGEGAFINVKSAPYNAQGNGVANDTGAILSAIAAAGTGGIVYFPPGIYMVDPIDLGSIPTVGRADSVILQGSGQSMPGLIASQGTILRARASQAYVIKVAALNVQLRDMCIDGNFLTTTAALRFEYFCNNATIRNVNVTRTVSWNGSTGGDLVGFDYDANNLEIDNVRFENCTFQQDAANAVNLARFCFAIVGTNVFENTCSNCRFIQGFNLVRLNGGSASFIDNCQFYSHGQGGIRIEGGGPQMCRFEDCYSEFVSGNFLYYVSVASVGTVPLTIKNCEFNANIQLNLECSQPTVLIGNLFKGNVNLAANTFSTQPVVSVGNSFANGADFTGAGLTNLVSISDEGRSGGSLGQIFSPGTLSVGTTPATTGIIRVPNAQYVEARNSTNSADIRLSGLDSSNNVVLGDSSANGTSLPASSSSFGTTPATSGTLRIPSAGSIQARDNANATNIKILEKDSSDNTNIDSLSGAKIQLKNNNVVQATVGSGFLSVGTTPAGAGVIRIPNAQNISARNASNAGDVALIHLDASNIIYLGDSGAAAFVFSVTGNSQPLIIGSGELDLGVPSLIFGSNVTPLFKQNNVASGNAGDFTIQAGGTTDTNKNGGILQLQGGVKNGSGLKGGVRLSLNQGTDSMFEVLELVSGQRIASVAMGTATTSTQMPANTGDGVLYFANTSTAPTASPVSGGIYYEESGAAKHYSPNGVITTMAPA